MSNLLIRAGFETRLKAWAITKSLPLYFENVPTDPPTAAYAEAYLLPAPTQSDTLDDLHRRYSGIFQVSLVMPIGVGAGDAAALEAELDALFAPAVPIVQGSLVVRVTSPMSAASAVQRPDRYVLPVSCAYRADTVPS